MRLIKDTYPEYFEDDGELTPEGLFRIIKHGAKLNH